MLMPKVIKPKRKVNMSEKQLANIANTPKFKKGVVNYPNKSNKGVSKSITRKSSVGWIIEDLKKKGVEGVKPEQVKEIFEQMFNLDKLTLGIYSRNEEMPIIIRIVSEHLLKEDRNFHILMDMIERAHGKTKQENSGDITNNANNLFQNINIVIAKSRD